MGRANFEPSYTFSEFLLEPGLTSPENSPDNVSLRVPFARNAKKGELPRMYLNTPFISAAMQAVTGSAMAVALAREGGMGFIFCSQPIESQAEMVANVKGYKAGFVVSSSNLSPDQALQDAVDLTEQTGHSTIAITDDGSAHGKLVGLLTDRDYWIWRDDLTKPVREFMTPVAKLFVGNDGISLEEANELLWKKKKSCLPVITKDGKLSSLVFSKDYNDNKLNPNALVDDDKRFIVGAALNTHDFKERAPALADAGVDAVCFDSSDGFSSYQAEAIAWVKKKYLDLIVGAGNVVCAEGFLHLAEAGADFIKIGVGGGSICITREQKGIGKGQATAVLDVAAARNEYHKKTGIYIPICSDGSIVHDYHIMLALAMGADFVMMGRYFAMCKESPPQASRVRGRMLKPYWGEGSERARNWTRYYTGKSSNIKFEEGVDGYVPLSGTVKENLTETLAKIKSTFSNCGASNVEELHRVAKLRRVSQHAIKEGEAHDIIMKDMPIPDSRDWRE